MSLREEMARYEQLTGESAEHIPISRLGGYLDGVDKGIEELEKIKKEIEIDLIEAREKINNDKDYIYYLGKLNANCRDIAIINKYINKLKEI